MESIFESSSYLFESSPYDASPSFLSFSSLADPSSSLFDLSEPSHWERDLFTKTKPSPASNASTTPSPDPSNPFPLAYLAFDHDNEVVSTPAAGDIGIFHTPTPGGKIVGQPHISHRSTSSSEGWNTPLTPSLTTKSSCDSFATFATGSDFYPASSSNPPGFAWDELSTNHASSSYTPSTPLPHRVQSVPTLNSSRPPRPVATRASMPALKEEDQLASTPSQWFDGTETAADILAQQQILNADDALAEDFDWVFGETGLGEALPLEGTIFEAFHQEDDHASGSMPAESSNWESTSSLPSYSATQPSNDFAWQAQDFNGLDNDFAFDTTDFTIDPMAIMGTSYVAEEQRPMSAPGLNVGESSGQMLSVHMPAFMTRRSISSDGLNHGRPAPPRDLFAYTPQHIPSGPPEPQPLYTSQPSPSYQSMNSSQYPRVMPPTPGGVRRGSTQLSVQINPSSGYSTYLAPSPLPPTPQSATFPSSGAGFPGSIPQPILMTRGATQPLPQTRRMSTELFPSSLPSSGMPAHLVRAQAIVQMQEAEEEAERQQLRRQAEGRRLGMEHASVMQPRLQNRSVSKANIMGWEGPSAQTGSMPILTHTPLVTVHPPPTQYYLGSAMPSTPHKVHPPPNRPIAGLPSPTKGRSVSTFSPGKTPKNRTPSSKRKPMQAGNFSWGETTFINFTSQDAEKLLTGVAPSGSQSKRRREEDAQRTQPDDGLLMEEDRLRSKRSRSNECLNL
ncbi:hypothetical protein P7C73_g3685, partial [Tremellales sp. Uapishka_1]